MSDKSYDFSVIMPPKWDYREPWTAPAYICQYLRHKGYSVQFLDYNIKLYNICRELGFESLWTDSAYHQAWVHGDLNFLVALIDLDEIRGEWVGFSCTATNRAFAYKMAGLLKQKNPDRTIVFGGHDVFYKHDLSYLRPSRVDAVVRDEGEHTIIELLENGISPEVAGLFVHDGREWQHTDSRPLIRDLDSIPFPTFEECDLAEYPVPDLPLMGSRGCIGRCMFCNDRIRAPGFRTRSAAHQVAELEYLKERYDTDFFIYNDPLMNGNLKVLDEKTDLILKRGLELRYGGNLMVRGDMPEEMFPKLRKSGFTVAIMGLENGSPNVLKLMGKMFTVEEAAWFLGQCRSAGMRVEINLIVGFPGETEENFQELLRFLKANRDNIDIIVSACTLNVVDSILFRRAKDYHIVLPDDSAHNNWYLEDGSNTLEIRLDRLNRLIAFGEELGIMHVRTDYEIEVEGARPQTRQLLEKYRRYWESKQDCSEAERVAALRRLQAMKKLVSKDKAVSFLNKLGLLERVVRLRARMGKI